MTDKNNYLKNKVECSSEKAMFPNLAISRHMDFNCQNCYQSHLSLLAKFKCSILSMVILAVEFWQLKPTYLKMAKVGETLS